MMCGRERMGDLNRQLGTRKRVRAAVIPLQKGSALAKEVATELLDKTEGLPGRPQQGQGKGARPDTRESARRARKGKGPLTVRTVDNELRRSTLTPDEKVPIVGTFEAASFAAAREAVTRFLADQIEGAS